MLSAGDSPYEYRGVAAPLLPLDHVGDHLIVGEVGVAVEVDRLAEDGGDVLRVWAPVAQDRDELDQEEEEERPSGHDGGGSPPAARTGGHPEDIMC